MRPFTWVARHGVVAIATFISLFFIAPPISAQQPLGQRDQLLPLTEFSPSLLGMYRPEPWFFTNLVAMGRSCQSMAPGVTSK